MTRTPGTGEMPVDIVVDGGGSGTRIGLVRGGELVLTRRADTCNPRVVGEEVAWQRLIDLLNWAAAGVEDIRSTCLALSSVSTPREVADAARLLAARRAECAALRAATCWLMNDVVPLACHAGCGVAIVCGTGANFAALGPDGTWAQASGLEYILADEGSGWDLGVRALRAVTRAADGRGPATLLSRLVPVALGLPADATLEDLHEVVYAEGGRKSLVARAAPAVLRAAGEGDPVARDLVEYAARELLLGAEACARRAGLPAGSPARYTGSLLLGDEPALREALVPLLKASPFAFEPSPGTDPLEGVRALALRLNAGEVDLGRVPLAARV
ncbi:ATPase [Carbonactinospora thermoautotrophica]|uniref:N-acetylglucosamine kinase n=1 Tax=Carbonactinospora thermoautotrophica TaxID=1469144 RepID=UPI00226D479B|nr:BadF/BadG/BcrA/BcrD ATPase family protein [Carbonactinospora thermoautotrophica]MCX9190167.1 ATPase [Carbonactinospora thermoautotrophica]